MNIYDKFMTDNKNGIVGLLSELICFRSIMESAKENMPFGTENAHCLEKILSAAKEMGFSVKNNGGYYGTADYFPENCNAADGARLGILCHLDVVPAGDGWSYPPFECTEKGGMLYGRGTTDDKGPAVSALYALFAVKELGVKLNNGVRLIFGTNEENGSADIEYYKRHDIMPTFVFTPDAEYPIINCEKGMARTVCQCDFYGNDIIDLNGGQVINAVPSEASCTVNGIAAQDIKQCTEKLMSDCSYDINENGGVKIICKGKSAHASVPSSGGINAITGLLELLSILPFKKSSQQETIRKINSLYPHKETDGKALGINMKDSSGELTHVISIIGTDNNKLVFRTDTRFPTCSSKAEINRLMKNSYSRAGIEITEFVGSEPHYTDENSELVKALSEVYEKRTGIKAHAVSIGGGTYVHEIEGGVAFGIEHPGTDYHIHGADEFAPISELLDNAAMFAQAIEKICG